MPDAGRAVRLRSTVDCPPTPVRLDPTAEDQRPALLPTPAPVPPLPGRLEEVGAEVAGATVRGWLCLPDGDGPFPLMQWIHGGPFSSDNAWSWRWNPWVMVAHGWAVLLPDPALSSGYGPGWIDRAWPYRAAPVWTDVEGLLDVVVTRPDIDSGRTACLGASFGGYLANWVAGHTDRFGAIVTHAGTWALDQKNDTADVAADWDRWFGRPAAHPGWYAENSPHAFADQIRTPMLVVHGNQDYRVPVSEALRLWFDLVRRWDGDPAELPHRFFNFTGQNHLINSPADAEVWYATILRPSRTRPALDAVRSAVRQAGGPTRREHARRAGRRSSCPAPVDTGQSRRQAPGVRSGSPVRIDTRVDAARPPALRFPLPRQPRVGPFRRRFLSALPQ